jgi:hypothetical protein
VWDFILNNMIMRRRIELTELELRMLLLLHDNESLFQPTTEEEIKTTCSVIKKAEDLMRELNAYDELDDSLVKWFLAKYNEQAKK